MTTARQQAASEGRRREEPDVRAMAAAAREASRVIAALPARTKDAVLLDMAEGIESRSLEILAANERDCDAARGSGLAAPKVQRLTLTRAGLAQMIAGVRQIAAMPDPVGQVTLNRRVPNGLEVQKVRAPLGVIAMVYEARPGVTIDAFSLCFKAGNACILRGGKEAEHSNAALSAIAHGALERHGVPAEALVNLSGTSREALQEMLTLETLIDLVIPRGGKELIEAVCRASRIPTVQHFQGVCHIFVDESADVERAIEICATAKSSAPATCNALECVLVHRNIADRFIPRMIERYRRDGVQVRATPLVQSLAPTNADVVAATPEDYGREFLDLIVAMRMVAGVDDAIEHIATYGSNHTDAILTEDLGPGGAAERFTARVQSSCVLVNASTRFNDGFQLGLGAEIGISTSRVHAYGPMGLEELTTQRWIVRGNGQTR